MSTSQLSSGTVVDGRFTVGAVVRTRVGATTYEATDPEGQTVALTIYDDECFPSALVLERSLRELRQLQEAKSPRVLAILDAGRHGDGIFEVSRPSPGQSLREYLKAGPMAPRDAGGILMQVGEGLIEGLRLGVIHRNLGADVIFPSAQGVRINGFAVGEPHGEGRGSLPTMAPEQVEGNVVDQRTLVYNLAALMHWMLTGDPLFSGAEEEVLEAHRAQEPGDGVHEVLRPALDKDARLRPMQLLPFLEDVARAIGVAGPTTGETPVASEVEAGPPSSPHVEPSAGGPEAGATPTSRGWTMFMAASEAEEEGDEAEPASSEAKPAAPAAPTPEAKPSTRGWTMFMTADEDDDEDDDEPSPPAPSESSAAPAKSEATPPAAATDDDKPSTRGWTMFMTADEEDDEDEAQQAADASAEPEPVAKSSAKSAPAKPAEAKPSTRGWTMFMQADEDDEEDDDDEPSPASAPAESPEDAASGDSPSSTEAKPSTRGWTMFMTEEGGGTEGEDAPAASEESPAEIPAPATAHVPDASESESSEAPAAASTRDAPAATPGAGEGGKSRGWTIFMEPAKDRSTPTESEAAPAPVVQDPASAPEAEAEAEAPNVVQAPVPGQPGSGQKKRGWTMFMNAPIPELKKPGGPSPAAGRPGSSGPVGSKPLVQTPPKPVSSGATTRGTPGSSGSKPAPSDKRGWTVFGAPAPMRTPAPPPLTPPPGVKPVRTPASAMPEPQDRETGGESEPAQGTPSPSSPASMEAPQDPGSTVPSGPQPAVNPSEVGLGPGGASAPPAIPPLGAERALDKAPPKRTGFIVGAAVVGVGIVATIVALLLG